MQMKRTLDKPRTTAALADPAPSTAAAIRHHFTVDVEEYYQVSALSAVAPRARWSGYESRVERSTMQLLALLGRHEARATFFVLGCVAHRLPRLVREIAGAEHEVASHGWGHRKVTDLTPEEFRGSVRRSKQCLEDISGIEVQGYRAPSFSIVRGREWALDVLIEEGYRYDSSLFPIRRPGYGYAGSPRDHHWVSRPAGNIAEFPPATLEKATLRIPAAGGAYLRLLPLRLIQSAFRQAEQRHVPATFYIHPWELDPDQPRFPVSRATRIRHYGGLARTARRIERLLEEFEFDTIQYTLQHMAKPDSADV